MMAGYAEYNGMIQRIAKRKSDDVGIQIQLCTEMNTALSALMMIQADHLAVVLSEIADAFLRGYNKYIGELEDV